LSSAVQQQAKAASKARRMDEHAEITVYQKASDLSMASCGYPYYIGGFFDDRDQLLCSPAGVIRDSKFFWNAKKITTKVNTEVTVIDRQNKQLSLPIWLRAKKAAPV
jgi:NADPH-dependent 2,4-dienoyl-CoA reductase/sulfur reductase-like enzyme